MKQSIKIAKANDLDIRSAEKFLDLMEQIFYSENRIDDMPIFKKIWKELGYTHVITDEQVTVIKLEMIRRYFSLCSGRWIKVLNTAEIMVDQVCAKEVNYIELHPFIKRAVEGEIMGQ